MAATTKDEMTGINGADNSFSFTFPYLKTKDIKVELFNSTDGRLELDSTKFTLPTATSISLDSIDTETDWQLVDGTPKSGVTGNIYRETSSDQLLATFYPGSAIRSEDLNNNYTQNLYSTQENTNDADDALDNSRVLESGVYKSAIDKATDAVDIADHAYIKAEDALDKAGDAKDATDALVGVYNTTTNLWETRGHGEPGDTAEGVGKALYDSLEALTTANAADEIADQARDTYAIPAKQATDALVGTTSDGGTTWTLTGTGLNGNPEGVAYAVSTADTAKDTYAVPAKTAADTAQLATDSLVGTTTDNGTTWTLQGDGQNNNKGVKYAVEKVDDWIVNGDGLGANEEGVPFAVQQSTDAVADATEALDNSRTKTDGSEAIPTPGTYTSAIHIADAALTNSRRSDGSGGYDSAITVAEAAVTTADLAEGIANTASANATAAQNAVTNAELFTPYATVSDIPANNVASITVPSGSGGSEYQTVPAVTITNTTGATGSGATATAVLTDGVVTSITVNTKGNNYDNGATVAIAQSTGTGGTHATATAVLGPLNEEKAEIADSTGLEDFTPLTGTPAGFILGDDGLTVKIKYNTSTPTWEWVNYYSNDPETRYRKKIIIENKINIDEDYTVGVGNNGFSVGPVTINGASTNPTVTEKILTIPENSTYLVL